MLNKIYIPRLCELHNCPALKCKLILFEHVKYGSTPHYLFCHYNIFAKLLAKLPSFYLLCCFCTHSLNRELGPKAFWEIAYTNETRKSTLNNPKVWIERKDFPEFNSWYSSSKWVRKKIHIWTENSKTPAFALYLLIDIQF